MKSMKKAPHNAHGGGNRKKIAIATQKKSRSHPRGVGSKPAAKSGKKMSLFMMSGR